MIDWISIIAGIFGLILGIFFTTLATIEIYSILKGVEPEPGEFGPGWDWFAFWAICGLIFLILGAMLFIEGGALT